MPPTHTPTIHPMSIKDISMFLYRKQIFVILPFHFSWLNWVRKCCSISANFCIVYSCSTFHPSDHAYCQLYQFIMLTFHPFWQFHSMESDKQTNRSCSSINSYTFSSIGSITSINLIETIYLIISISLILIPSLISLIAESQRCQLNLYEKSGKIYTTGKHFSGLPIMTVATILTRDSTYLFCSIQMHCILSWKSSG